MAVRRFARKNSFIFTWAGDEPLELTFDTRLFVVPPHNVTAKPTAPGSIYRLESARTSHGDLVPGTLVVSDEEIETEAGGYKVTFRVDEMCQYLTRERPALFDVGFNIVADVNDARPAIAEGRPLYERSLDRAMEATLQAELERQQKIKDRGQSVTPASNAERVKKAIAHLNSRAAERQREVVSENDLRAALEGSTASLMKPRQAPASAEVVADVPVDGPALKAAPTAIYQETVELGMTLTKNELVGLLAGDRETVEFVVEKIKARREDQAKAKSA